MAKRDTTGIGNYATGMMLAALMRSGYPVLLPFGEGHRYDLAFESDGRLLRMQVKTGRLRKGVIVFNTVSFTNGQSRAYIGEVDVFGVYCVDIDKAYIVPVEVLGKVKGYLRVDRPKNNQSNLRWAHEYEIAVRSVKEDTLFRE